MSDEDILRVVREHVRLSVREASGDFYSSRSRTIVVELYIEGDKQPFASDSFTVVDGEADKSYY